MLWWCAPILLGGHQSYSHTISQRFCLGHAGGPSLGRLRPLLARNRLLLIRPVLPQRAEAIPALRDGFAVEVQTIEALTLYAMLRARFSGVNAVKSQREAWVVSFYDLKPPSAPGCTKSSALHINSVSKSVRRSDLPAASVDATVAFQHSMNFGPTKHDPLGDFVERHNSSSHPSIERPQPTIQAPCGLLLVDERLHIG